jgi:hypothetical protein
MVFRSCDAAILRYVKKLSRFLLLCNTIYPGAGMRQPKIVANKMRIVADAIFTKTASAMLADEFRDFIEFNRFAITIHKGPLGNIPYHSRNHGSESYSLMHEPE